MDPKALIKRFYEEIVSKNLLEHLPEYVSQNCLSIDGAHCSPLGVDGMRQHLLAVRSTYPAYSMQILRQYGEGEYVISVFVMEGLHEGEFLGIQPSHKRLSFTGINIDRVAQGKIVEHGGAVNTFETLYAHGLIRAGLAPSPCCRPEKWDPGLYSGNRIGPCGGSVSPAAPLNRLHVPGGA